MKNLLSSFTIICLLFFATSCGIEDKLEDSLIDLSGNWTGEGYQCPAGTFQTQQIRIEHDIDSDWIVAMKITGNACVPANDTTFAGWYNGIASEFRPDFQTGMPGNPSCCWVNSTIQVIDETSIKDIDEFPGLEFTKN